MTTSRFSQELDHASHSVSRQALLAGGMPERILRRASLRRTSYGFYSSSGSGRRSTAQRIVDALPLVPPSGAIGAWAAAYVHGADWLDGADAYTGVLQPVTVILASTTGRGQYGAVRCVRHRLPSEDLTERFGIPVTTPVRTTFDGIRLAPSPADALVFADAALRFGLVRPAELAGFVDAHRGWAGVERARWATPLADGAVLSPWESRLRWSYLAEARLPAPLVNRTLTGLDGRAVGTPDLFDPEAALAVEYDGEGHRDAEQHSYDNAREELLESLNVTVVRIDRRAFAHRGAMVERLREGYRRGKRRDRGADGWLLAPRLRPAT